MIEGWLKTIRDHPDRPPALQRHVLTMLALRLDWGTGRGFAGVRDLMADADVCKNTVMRATSWATGSNLLLRTRRGHYINAQTTIASEWQLTQSPSGDTLGQSQSPNGANPKSQWGQPKVSVGTTHQESSSSKSSSSPRTSAAGTIRSALPGVTDEETDEILNRIEREHQPRSLGRFVAHLAGNGDLRPYLPCDTGNTATRHSEACRRGDGKDCHIPWCQCRCHGQATP